MFPYERIPESTPPASGTSPAAPAKGRIWKKAALGLAVLGAAALLVVIVILPRLRPSGDDELIVAVNKGAEDEVRVLLARGADPNATDAVGRSALQLAAMGGSLRIAELLLSEGVAHTLVIHSKDEEVINYVVRISNEILRNMSA